MTQKRSSFTGKIGFVLAAAGSAVGLGNIWRFPYLAATYGGGTFLVTYLILAVTFGFTLMCGEIALGRKTGKSAIHAFSDLNKKYKFVGLLASVVPMIILPYYSVIGGWVSKYLAVSLTGGLSQAAADNGKYFGEFISKPIEPLVWFFVFMGVTALIVLFEVEKGIEKVSKVMMPVLVMLTIGIAIYSMTLPNAMQGVKYYLIPDFSNFSFMTVLAALGQLFYSMSLAMGIMITYGSYMKKEVSIESSVHQIELFDTGIAFLAGLMIIPAVFSFTGHVPEKAGAGLMFQVLPGVFNSLGATTGSIISSVFFLLVLFAALTSSISLMETVVSIFRDKFGWGRKFTCLLVFIGCLLLGVPSSLGHGPLAGITLLGKNFLDFFDFISNSIIMPLVAFLTCIFIGYVIKPKTIIDEIELGGRKFKFKPLFVYMIKYIAPVFIVLILTSSLLEAFGIIKF